MSLFISHFILPLAGFPSYIGKNCAESERSKEEGATATLFVDGAVVMSLVGWRGGARGREAHSTLHLVIFKNVYIVLQCVCGGNGGGRGREGSKIGLFSHSCLSKDFFISFAYFIRESSLYF